MPIVEHAPCTAVLPASTAPSPAGAGPSPSPASWRALGRDLWVGRSEAGPVGMIERGRRFVATDADGRSRGAHRSLDAAMAAFEAVQPGGGADAGRSWDPLVLVATLAGAAGALLATYALVGI